MTSATEELCSLLDERGMEHYDGAEMTLWLKDEHGYRASAHELHSGRLSVHIWCDTPAQAVEATLGRGECKDMSGSAKHADVAFECSECGCWVVYDEFWDTRIYVCVDGQPMHIHPHFCPFCGRKVVE